MAEWIKTDDTIQQIRYRKIDIQIYHFETKDNFGWEKNDTNDARTGQQSVGILMVDSQAPVLLVATLASKCQW